MPLYAYQCKSCSHRFEELTTMEKRDQVLCPQCGGETTRAWDAPGVFGVNFSGSAKEPPCECGQCPRRCACGQ